MVVWGQRLVSAEDQDEDKTRAVVAFMQDDLSSARLLAFTATIAISLVVMGPFDTYSQMTLGERILYWPPLVFGSLLLATAVRAYSRHFYPDVEAGWRCVGESAAMATLFTPVIIMWTHTINGPGYEMHFFSAQLWVIVAAVYMMISISVRLSDLSEAEAKVEAVARPAEIRPRLYRRLSRPSAAPIVHLTVNDHYVELFQSDGAHHRLLLRFGDAVDEMDGVDGFCVHRSHWVARSAIRSVYREKGRDFVKLSNGTSVPVSRTYRPNLVKAGLLEERD